MVRAYVGFFSVSGVGLHSFLPSIIVWNYKRWVIATLSLLFLGQWVLVFVGTWPPGSSKPLSQLFPQGLRVGNVRWNRLIGACVPTDSRAEYVVLLGAFSIYSTRLSMCMVCSTLNTRNLPAAGFDFIVAIFTVLGVRKFRRGDLATLLRHQGIGYFALILAVHTVTVVSAGSFSLLRSHLTVPQALVFYDLNCTCRRCGLSE